MALLEGQRPTNNNAAANSQERSSDTSTSHDTPSAQVACADANKVPSTAAAGEVIATATTATAAADAPTPKASSVDDGHETVECVTATIPLRSPPTPPPYVSLTELPKLSRVFSANAPVVDNTTTEVSQPKPTSQMEMTAGPSPPSSKNYDSDDTGFDSDATAAEETSSGPGNVVDHSKYARCSLDERRKSIYLKSNDNDNNHKKLAADDDLEAEKRRNRPRKILPYTLGIMQATIGCIISVARCGCFSSH